jgi:DNA repair ATPase RecN
MNHLAGKRNVAPLLFDESSKFVSKGHSEQVARFLYEISSYMNKQVFMVTHDALLAQIGDRAYSFQLDNKGRSRVTRVDANAESEKK